MSRAPNTEGKSRRRLPRHVLVPLGGGLATLVILLLAWWTASAAGLVSAVFLPSPVRVWRAAWSVAVNGYANATLWQHALASLSRVLSALVASILVAVPVGLFMALSPVGRAILDPIIEFIRPLPPLAYLPLIIIWFGIGEPSKTLIIAIAMFAPIAIATALGVRGVSPSQINAVRSFGATRSQVLLHVLIPGALPSIVTGIRIALGAGWTTLVAAELVAATTGLGYMIQSAAQFLVTEMVMVGILVISALAFLFELTFRLIEHFFIPWARAR
ncbi:taurine transport system permease protein [Aureimonas altamirensis DSM 21988]|jgi:taurine transport system permease protein|uniref:Taurine transport system permease protein n=1 Tax=Aureimonas altamirensis DSM 21988 TaxID=1121026 RepID=A0ABY1IG51_9HYPH|nr:ABC transporter permease subunit [Aureimonas altamirensis]SHJ12825.1 taurine transport system permease protein [Aureimonas altamirensis DSM 21988]